MSCQVFFRTNDVSSGIFPDSSGVFVGYDVSGSVTLGTPGRSSTLRTLRSHEVAAAMSSYLHQSRIMFSPMTRC